MSTDALARRFRDNNQMLTSSNCLGFSLPMRSLLNPSNWQSPCAATPMMTNSSRVRLQEEQTSLSVVIGICCAFPAMLESMSCARGNFWKVFSKAGDL